MITQIFAFLFSVSTMVNAIPWDYASSGTSLSNRGAGTNHKYTMVEWDDPDGAKIFPRIFTEMTGKTLKADDIIRKLRVKLHLVDKKWTFLAIPADGLLLYLPGEQGGRDEMGDPGAWHQAGSWLWKGMHKAAVSRKGKPQKLKWIGIYGVIEKESISTLNKVVKDKQKSHSYKATSKGYDKLITGVSEAKAATNVEGDNGKVKILTLYVKNNYDEEAGTESEDPDDDGPISDHGEENMEYEGGKDKKGDSGEDDIDDSDGYWSLIFEVSQ